MKTLTTLTLFGSRNHLNYVLTLNESAKERNRNTTANSTYPKGGVSCSKDRFVVTGTFVLLINICGESPALRVAAKR
jgi:hypothetical protein